MLTAKRCVDILLSGAGLVVLCPVLVLLSLVIRVSLGKPILFKQVRPGLKGKPFLIYKFRTMLNVKDAAGNILPDGARLTPVGTFIRRTSLDELPELYNVLKGDMSLVGPRPLLMEYLPLYSTEQSRRHEVKPGITGWAQVNGRNAITWEEKFVFDVWYVDNQSLLLDIKIILMTFIKVLKRQGINQSGHETMEKFTGTRHSTEDKVR